MHTSVVIIHTPLGNTPHAHVRGDYSYSPWKHTSCTRRGDLVPLAQSDNSPWKEPTSVPYNEH